MPTQQTHPPADEDRLHHQADNTCRTRIAGQPSGTARQDTGDRAGGGPYLPRDMHVRAPAPHLHADARRGVHVPGVCCGGRPYAESQLRDDGGEDQGRFAAGTAVRRIRQGRAAEAA